jgi:site-specific recombinase XerD
MPTYKAEVYAHQKKKDGTYNIKIRVTHNQRKKYIATPYFVTQDDLTRSLKIKNQRYIDYCDDMIRQFRRRSDSLGLRINDMTVDQVVDFITTRQEEFKLDFFEFAGQRIAMERAEGRFGTSSSCEIALRLFKRWTGKERLDINDITRAMVSDYVAFLNGLGHKPNTIRAYVLPLSKYYYAAENIYNETDTLIKRNPFRAVKLPKEQENTKKALTVEQIKAIRDYQTTVNSEELARDLFMLSFYLIGMNLADIYSCEKLEDGAITYYRQKTRDRRADRAEMCVIVQEEARPLVEKYRGRERVFNIARLGTQKQARSAISYGLKRIAKALGFDDTFSFYSARHSWATIAANDAGVDVYTVHLALLHSSPIPITELYIKRDFSKVNEANRKVLDLLKSVD